MAFNPDDQPKEDLADINIVPLVDVMLVLLIIFMATAPLSIGGIPVSLPTSKAKTTAIEEDRIILTVDAKGFYFLDKSKVEKKVLTDRLKAIYQFRTTKDLYIRADHTVSYGSVVDAMSAAKIAGVVKISMLTKADGAK